MHAALSVAAAGENPMGWSPHSLGVHKLLGPLRPLVTPVVDAASRRRLAKCVNVADLRLAAEKRMHRMCFGYLDSGADDEVTLRRSKDAFLERELHYRVLAGTRPETLDVSAALMGSELALPFFSCPCAGNRMFHTEGEVAAAAVARERGSLYCLSTLATSTPDQVAAGDAAGEKQGSKRENARARNTHLEATLNLSFAAQARSPRGSSSSTSGRTGRWCGACSTSRRRRSSTTSR